MPVLEIADKAFYRKNLTSVTFPSEIEEIGNLAFGDNVINYIVVYGHDTNAMHDSFDGNDLKTIYGHNDGNIESYAERIQVEFRNIGTYETQADIVSVEQLPSQEIIYGEEPIPPDKVEVTLDNDDIISVNVFWDEVKSVERSTIDVTMSGTLILPDNVTNNNNLKAELLIMVRKLNVVSVEKVSDIELEYGDDIVPFLENIKELLVTLDDEASTEIKTPVTWSLGDFDSEKPGNYVIKGELHLGDFYENPDGIQPRINVVVNKRWIVSVDHVHRIDVGYGTAYEDLPLSRKVSVNLSDHTNEFFNIEWESQSYNPYIPGTYGFVGKILMDDVTENRENIQVYLMVILRPEVADLEADDDSLFIVRDLSGREFAMQATTELNESIESNPSLSFKLQPTKVNNLFIDDISEMWEVIDDNNTEYKVVYVERKGVGSSDEPPVYEGLEINGIPLDHRLWESGYIDINGNERDRGRDVRMATHERIRGNAEYELT